MATVHTVNVLIERTMVTSVTWDINGDEFSEWAGHAFDATNPQTVLEFIKADRFYHDGLRDKIRDLPEGSWHSAFNPMDVEAKVVIL